MKEQRAEESRTTTEARTAVAVSLSPSRDLTIWASMPSFLLLLLSGHMAQQEPGGRM